MTFTPDTVHLMSGTLDTSGFGTGSTSLDGVGVVFDDLESASDGEPDGEPGAAAAEDVVASPLFSDVTVDVPLFELPGLQLNPEAVVAPVAVGDPDPAVPDGVVPQLPVIAGPAPVVMPASGTKRQRTRPSRAKPKP